MSPWTELVLDLVAVVLVSAGLWFIFPPLGLIAGGIGVFWLSIGLKARRGYFREPEKTYKAVEVDAE